MLVVIIVIIIIYAEFNLYHSPLNSDHGKIYQFFIPIRKKTKSKYMRHKAHNCLSQNLNRFDNIQVMAWFLWKHITMKFTKMSFTSVVSSKMFIIMSSHFLHTTENTHTSIQPSYNSLTVRLSLCATVTKLVSTISQKLLVRFHPNLTGIQRNDQYHV